MIENKGKCPTWLPPLQHLQPPVSPPPPSSPLKSVPVSGVDGDILLSPWKESAELMPRPLKPQWQLQWLSPLEGELRRRQERRELSIL